MPIRADLLVPSATVGFLEVFGMVRTATFAVVVVAWFTVGQKRYVKLGVLLVLAERLVDVSVRAGVGRAIRELGIVGIVVVVLNFIALLSWRAPRQLAFMHGAPPGDPAWPPYAASGVERWTRELAALGFEAPTDVWYRWSAAGADRVRRLRLMRHGSEPVWASIYVGVSTKSTARSLYTALPEGRWLITDERPSDRALTRDPKSVRVRGSSFDTFARLLERHLAALRTSGHPAEKVGDVASEHARSRNAWIEALVAQGDARAAGSDVRLSMGAVARAVPRAIAAFVT